MATKTNLAMSTKLECGLTIESKPLYIMLDPVRMIKVLLNSLRDRNVISNPTGLAKWEHVEQLVKLWSEGDLHLSNKLSKHDINYDSNKMNVKLLCQSLVTVLLY